MHYVFYVPGLPFHGGSLAGGSSLGGSESAAYYLAREVARRGHRATLFGTLSPAEEGRWEGVDYRSLGLVHAQTPSEEAFQRFVAQVEHDVLLVQRMPHVFAYPNRARLRLWWMHDLALTRHLSQVEPRLWAIDQLLCVSRFHRRQVLQSYALPPQRVTVLPNGVDTTLFRRPATPLEARQPLSLLYSSRPERGLQHLLGGWDEAPGIMELLWRADPRIHLRVCSYANDTHGLHAEFYRTLEERCRTLPNVTWLGAGSKTQLARWMEESWMHVYPTSFEEVSCITAMECQKAGTPMVTTRRGALPETLRGGGVVWVGQGRAGAPRRAAFAEAILALRNTPSRWEALHKAALALPTHDWSAVSERLERIVEHAFAAPRRARFPARGALTQEQTQARLRTGAHSNAESALATQKLCTSRPASSQQPAQALLEALCASPLQALPAGKRVLYLGCALDTLLQALLEAFPQLHWVVLDASPAHRQTMRTRAKRSANLRLRAIRNGRMDLREAPFSAVICAAALHCWPDPAALLESLSQVLTPQGCPEIGSQGWIAICGPTAAHCFSSQEHSFSSQEHSLSSQEHGLSSQEHSLSSQEKSPTPHPPLDAQALHALCGNALQLQLLSTKHENVPGYLGLLYPQNLDWRRSIPSPPQQSLTVCLLTRPGSQNLSRCLRSVACVADEVLIGLNGGGKAEAAQLLAQFPHVRIIRVPSPLEVGFAACRNRLLPHARGDWLLWLDDDEELVHADCLLPYLRENLWEGYALAQHHLTVEPPGILSTDIPCRIFRNRLGFRFRGRVHEHPAQRGRELPKWITVLPQISILHHGYRTEAIRRARFQRNLPLMRRDRREDPQRLLGRFLWIRDLVLLNRFQWEAEQRISAGMRSRAAEAQHLWRTLLREGYTQHALDALPYYSECSEALEGNGIQCELRIAFARSGSGFEKEIQATPIRGVFSRVEDLEHLTQALCTLRLTPFRGEYA